MIIAIPAVLNTIQSAQRKTFLEFAQKAMNEAEKAYMSSALLGSTKLPSEETIYAYDIKKDLGLSSTGDYFGVAEIIILRTKYGEDIFHNIYLFNKDLALLYDEYSNGELSDQLIQNRSEADIIPDFKIEDVNLKELIATANLSNICNYWDTSVIDGATNTQYYCTNPNKRSIWGNSDNDECPYNADQEYNAYITAIQKYLAYVNNPATSEPPISCPIG